MCERWEQQGTTGDQADYCWEVLDRSVTGMRARDNGALSPILLRTLYLVWLLHLWGFDWFREGVLRDLYESRQKAHYGTCPYR